MLPKQSADLHIGVLFKWFVSETPYLIHEAPKAPHITGCGVLLVVEGLYVYMLCNGHTPSHPSPASEVVMAWVTLQYIGLWLLVS